MHTLTLRYIFFMYNLCMYVQICKDLNIALNGSEHFNENTKWSYVTINTRDLGGFMRQPFITIEQGLRAESRMNSTSETIQMTISPENPKTLQRECIINRFQQAINQCAALSKKVPINISFERVDIFIFGTQIECAVTSPHSHVQSPCIETLDSFRFETNMQLIRRRDVTRVTSPYSRVCLLFFGSLSLYFCFLTQGYMLINFHHSTPKTICCVITADAENGSIAIKCEMVTTVQREKNYIGEHGRKIQVQLSKQITFLVGKDE